VRTARDHDWDAPRRFKTSEATCDASSATVLLPWLPKSKSLPTSVLGTFRTCQPASKMSGSRDSAEAADPDGQITRAIYRPLCPAPFEKNSDLQKSQITLYRSPSRSSEGYCATSRNVERDAVDAGGALDGRCGLRTAKGCGPEVQLYFLHQRTDLTRTRDLRPTGGKGKSPPEHGGPNRP